MRSRWGIAAIALGLVSTAFAQHAEDNAVVSAQDAFGITIGTETIGLYSPDEVRGFSPQIAGNARIRGLYFDQQAPLSSRVLEGSTIRVGINTINYPFPAPTGIVDYDLRHVSDKPGLTAVLDAGPFEAWGVDLDGQYPIASMNLKIPVGLSYRISAGLPGYTNQTVSVGLAPQWSPREGITVRAFWDQQDVSNAKTAPLIFMAEPSLPPHVPATYLGQSWANGESLLQNYGATVEARLNNIFSLAVGLFRSTNDSPTSYADLYENTLTSGAAEHFLIGYPSQRTGSTSGEARLIGDFAEGSRKHQIVLSIRGRDAVAYYGGADVEDVGASLVGDTVPIPRPDFVYTDVTRDQNQLASAGIAYRGQWVDRGELSVGVQKNDYRRTISAPQEPEATRTNEPWRFYGIAVVTVTKAMAFYAGYTQGIEDSGIAPSNATNRGEILPATQTWQCDAGVQYAVTPKVKLITGVFDVHKPYFNVNASNVYTDIGDQSHKGYEFSIAGEFIKDLNIVAGLEILDAQVTATQSGSTPLGSREVGQNDYLAQINADYRLQRWPAFSFDLTLYGYGRRAASFDNSVSLPVTRAIDLGARYRFDFFRAPASLRLLVQNVENVYSWALTDSAGFSPAPRRSAQIYLTVDF